MHAGTVQASKVAGFNKREYERIGTVYQDTQEQLRKLRSACEGH